MAKPKKVKVNKAEQDAKREVLHKRLGIKIHPAKAVKPEVPKRATDKEVLTDAVKIIERIAKATKSKSKKEGTNDTAARVETILEGL